MGLPVQLALQVCHYLVWFPLAILVIAAILHTGVNRYPLIFTYMTVSVLLAVAEMPSALSVHSSHHTEAQTDLHFRLYAWGQGITHLLIFAVVVSFVLRATQELPIRHLIRTALAVFGPLFIVVTFFIHYNGSEKVGYWMTPWTRDMNFCAALVDMVLWGLLLISRVKQPILLLLAGGMGIMFAGDAISDAIRSIAIHEHSTKVWISASVFSWFKDAASLYVWWQAFRRDAATVTAYRAAATKLG